MFLLISHVLQMQRNNDIRNYFSYVQGLFRSTILMVHFDTVFYWKKKLYFLHIFNEETSIAGNMIELKAKLWQKQENCQF